MNETNDNDIKPRVKLNPSWYVVGTERVSACDNRPGRKMIYVTVTDDKGTPLRGVKVRFDTEPSEGMAWDHPNVWGLTNENGRVDWEHLGVPTRYRVYMDDDRMPLVENIRTDLGNEYCEVGGILTSFRPVNRPGVYSYRIEIKRRW